MAAGTPLRRYTYDTVVEWTSRLTVNRTPTVILFARTLWDSGAQNTLIPDEEPDYFVWTEAVQGEPITRPSHYKLPDTLKTGMYEIRVGASSMNSDAATYAVPFVIAESCFGGAK